MVKAPMNKDRKNLFKILLIIDAGIIALGLILCMVLPQRYTAEAIFVRVGVEMEQNPLLATLLTTPAAVPAVAVLDISNIVSTRWVLDRIIDRHNLMEYYHKEKREEMYELLRKKIKVKVKPDGMVILTYRDRDPQKAYEICNEVVHVLDEFHREVRFSYYSSYLAFLEKARKDLEKEIKIVEDSISRFLKTYNVWLDETGVKKLYELLPEELREEIVKKELEYRVTRFKTGKDSPLSRKLKEETGLLYRQWEELVKRGIEKEKDIIFPSLREVPGLYITFSHLLAEMEIKNEVYGFLMKEYYQALTKRNKERTFIEVIDPPRVPESPSFPNKKLFMLAFLLFAIFFDVLYLEFTRK